MAIKRTPDFKKGIKRKLTLGPATIANKLLNKAASHAEGIRAKKKAAMLAEKAKKQEAEQLRRNSAPKSVDALERAKQNKGGIQIFDVVEADNSPGIKLTTRKRKSI